ncbi:MAG: TadE/TadG family type IV pilus assembly protein [Candidatus Dormibacteria bacterium]
MTEFALLAPLLFLLLLGLIDFGRALFYNNELTNAVGQATRIAVLPNNTCNTTFGKPCNSTNVTVGESVCQALRNETTLIAASQWQGCPTTASDSDATPALPTGIAAGTATGGASSCATSACSNDVYVTIEQATVSSANCTDAGWSSESTTATPRNPGNLPIKVTVYYYYQPFTPMIGAFFPKTFRMITTSCGRPEY